VQKPQFFSSGDGSPCPLAPLPLPRHTAHVSSGCPSAWGHSALHSTGAAVAPKPFREGDVDAGHACWPRSHCQGCAWAVRPAFPSPPLCPKEGKTGQSSRRVARVTFFFGCRAVPAAELAGAVCWELGQPLCPRTGVSLPRATQQHGATSRGMQLGGSGWEPGAGAGGTAGPWRSRAEMKNAKALLELEACGAEGPFWLGFGKSRLRATEPPSEHRWFPFGRLSKELPPWQRVPPCGGHCLFAWEKMSLIICPSWLSNFKAQQEDILRWETAPVSARRFAWRSAGGRRPHGGGAGAGAETLWQGTGKAGGWA